MNRNNFSYDLSIDSKDDRMQDMVRTRMAPSPTGADLHIGNVYTALINFIFARQNKGKFILRIEDTDQNRKIEKSEERIFESLSWLGLIPDESPQKGGPYGPYRQSERKKIYQKYTEELIEKKQAYYCFCKPERLLRVRDKLQKEGKPPMYDGLCKGIPFDKAVERIRKGEKYVVRLDVPDEGETCFQDLIRGRICFKNALIDDQILLKSDGFPTYHLAVVVDDYLMKISHVIRAEEWLSSTPKHILLYKAFGWKPPYFAHLPILRNPDKSKLSKRKNPVWVSWYKDQGFLKEAIINYLLTLGWSHPQDKTIFSLDEAVHKFSFNRVNKRGPVFDIVKLTWINGEYIRMLDNQDLGERIYSFLNKKYDRSTLLRIIPLIKERIKKLSDLENLIDFFFIPPKIDLKLLFIKGRSVNEIKTALEKILDKFKEITKWNRTNLHSKGDSLVYEINWKPFELFQLIRIAISGKTITPPLFESMEILGKEETVRRIEKVIASFPPSGDQPQQSDQ